jgi:hypothetical protein
MKINLRIPVLGIAAMAVTYVMPANATSILNAGTAHESVRFTGEYAGSHEFTENWFNLSKPANAFSFNQSKGLPKDFEFTDWRFDKSSHSFDKGSHKGSGTYQGTKCDPSDTTPVPEPGYLLLVGGGLAALACFRRRMTSSTNK